MSTVRTLEFSQDELVGLRMSTVRTLEFSQDELVGLRIGRATNEYCENGATLCHDSDPPNSSPRIPAASAGYPSACETLKAH